MRVWLESIAPWGSSSRARFACSDQWSRNDGRLASRARLVIILVLEIGLVDQYLFASWFKRYLAGCYELTCTPGNARARVKPSAPQHDGASRRVKSLSEKLALPPAAAYPRARSG